MLIRKTTKNRKQKQTTKQIPSLPKKQDLKQKQMWLYRLTFYRLSLHKQYHSILPWHQRLWRFFCTLDISSPNTQPPHRINGDLTLKTLLIYKKQLSNQQTTN